MMVANSVSRQRTWLLVSLLAIAFPGEHIAHAQVSVIESLSDEEKKQVEIADRFLTVLERSPRRGTALDRVYGLHAVAKLIQKVV